MAQICNWRSDCLMYFMWTKIKRLFVIKTRFEAYLIIYALALGSLERGKLYLDQYPGYGGVLLCFACTGTVFLAGAKILDAIRMLEERNQYRQH